MAAKRILIFLLVIILLSLLSIYSPKITGDISISSNIKYPLENAVLARVIDGDTIELDSGEHVRLLGINTPEKKIPFSNASTAFLKQFEGKPIILERDKEDTDKYKRKLRYIFYESRFLNQEILENGFANAYYLPGLKYEKQLLNAETQARALELGIWQKSSEVCSTHSCIILKELNPIQEFFIISTQCNIACNLDSWFAKDAGRNVFYLSNLSSLEEKTYYSPNNKSVWNDDGDRFFIFDSEGRFVLFYEYVS